MKMGGSENEMNRIKMGGKSENETNRMKMEVQGRR